MSGIHSNLLITVLILLTSGYEWFRVVSSGYG